MTDAKRCHRMSVRHTTPRGVGTRRSGELIAFPELRMPISDSNHPLRLLVREPTRLPACTTGNRSTTAVTLGQRRSMGAVPNLLIFGVQ